MGNPSRGGPGKSPPSSRTAALAPSLPSVQYICLASLGEELPLVGPLALCPCAAVLPPPRYLIPCSHVMLSQKRAVKELDLYGKAAAKFLSLIPCCCRPESLPAPEREEERAAWSKGEGSARVVSWSRTSWWDSSWSMHRPLLLGTGMRS